MAAIIISRCSVSLVNEVFLTTYGFVYTNTIIGTFLFQQWIYYPVIILFTGLGCWFGRPFHPNGVIIDWSWLTLPLGIRGACDLLVTIALWYFLLRTKDFRDRKPNCLTANVEELASGTLPIPRDIVTWGGIRRRRGMRSIRARIPKAISSLVYNALFRRVLSVNSTITGRTSPVETRRQVLIQHLFSLAAIALLIARTVIELQKASGNLPSRTLVEPCQGAPGFNPDNNHTLYIRLPHLRGVVESTQPSATPYVVNISATYQCNMGGTVAVDDCTQETVRTQVDESRLIDWYLTYQCPSSVVRGGGLSIRQRSCSLAGYQYNIQSLQVPGNVANRTTNSDSILNDRLPGIWLIDINPGREILTPYLTPPMEPEPGWHMVFDTHVAQRKFIVSSPVWDAIMGSDPTYETIVFFPGSQHTRQRHEISNLTDSATGFIHSPEYLDASRETPRDLLRQGVRGPSNLCDTIEEYRITSSFDLLASIGGLLALLQGIHVFIFGRPLFWGMFGGKIISPFGLAGQFATSGFKRRLQEHYQTQDTVRDGGNQTEAHINMTQFLLDYVIDMGPASPPSRAQKGDIDLESDSENEAKYIRIQSTEHVELEAARNGEGTSMYSREATRR
ncbi:unnamed protein product [Rhizoctonia solani]|uniref:Uncharacterized protein n=1 Tax=Rhizoctonia solani TaxID=456999 RepID=A0A8H3GWY1_9AGAM|nr:unnamed protein product [Rhizoctonia solani]